MKFLNSWDKYKKLNEEAQGSGTGKVSYMYGYVLSTGENKLTVNKFLEEAKTVISKGAIQQGSKILSKVGEGVKINIERISKGKQHFKLDFTNTVNGFGWDGKFNGTVVFDDIEVNGKYSYKVTAPDKLGNIPFAGCLIYDYASVDNPSIPMNKIVSTIQSGSFVKQTFVKSKDNSVEFEAKTPIIYIVYGDITPEPVVEAVPLFDGFDFDSPNLSVDGKANIKKTIETNKKATTPVEKYTIKTGATKDGEDVQLSVGKNAIRDKAFPNGTTRLNWDFWLVTNRYDNIEAYLKELGVTNIEKIGVPKDANDTSKIYGKFDPNDLASAKNRFIEIKPI